LFASNNDTKDRLKGWVSPSFWEDIRVTFTAVDPKQIDEALVGPFDRKALLQTHGIPTDKFIVLCVGQFIDRKGRWTFLESAASMRDIDPEVFFVWLTPTAPDPDAQKRIDSYNVGDNFRWILSERVGKERADVLRFFRISDVFTLPSFVEGLPIALLEAMALERPSISTNVYAIPEAVKDMNTGILIDPGDSAALVRSILRLKNDPGLRFKLATAGRKHVIDSFDENDAARIAISAYEEALSGG
jgi:glycosyltransferase involved in cell wall biosynthesis